MPNPAERGDGFYPRDRAEWRRWLEENHATSSGVWLIYYRKESGKPCVEYAEAVEEALCFGWIDSRPGKIDHERWMQLFSPRKPRSAWSRINKERIERMIAQGRMTPAGLAKIEAAKRDGSWSTLDAVERMEVPMDLAAALAADPAAEANFRAFPPSSVKGILFWIQSARTPATREKRIRETVETAAQNRRANEWWK